MNSSLFRGLIIETYQSAQRRFKVHGVKISDGVKNRKKNCLNKVIETHDKCNKWLKIFEKNMPIREFMSASNEMM